MTSTAFHPSVPLQHSVAHQSISRRHSSAASLRPDVRRATPTTPRNEPKIFCAQTTPRAPPVYTPLPPAIPKSVPYPDPPGTAGAFATLARDAESIPAYFHTLCDHPRLASLPALIDEHHTPSKSFTFKELGAAIRTCSVGLRKLGLIQADIVSFFSENSHRWGILDQAIMTCGAAAAVRGVSAPAPELAFIFQNSLSCALFVEHTSALRRLLSAGVDLSNVKFIVMLFGSASDASPLLPSDVSIYSYDDVMQIGQDALKTETFDSLFAKSGSNGNGSNGAEHRPSRDDIATLLYTSGTTGNPKGVVLTHENLLQQLQHISLGNLDPKPGEVFVSILPCWHVFERTAAYWCLSKGVSLVYSNRRMFRNDLAKHRPHMLISVPRIFESLHGTIMTKLRSASNLQRQLFTFFYTVSIWFVCARRRVFGLDVLGKAYLPLRLLELFRMLVLAPLYALANLVVWRKIRGGVGGRLRICLSGGGTIAGHLEDFFECAGIPICVGYGLTETSPVIANRFGQRNVRGSTGMPVSHMDVKLVHLESRQRIMETGKQGVLFARGASIFREYWKNPEATSKAFDSEGYFNTGDLAYYAHGGDIVICGRSKDVIVLSNGENIEPAAIEDALVASPFIDQVLLVGQDQRGLGALIVPKLDELEEVGLVSADFRRRVEHWLKNAKENSSELAKAEEELTKDVEFWKAITDEIRKRNSERAYYSQYDNILHTQIVLEPFSVENGMLTETLKVKKNVVNQVYSKRIASMFEPNRN